MMSVSYVNRAQANPETLAFYDKAEQRFEMLLGLDPIPRTGNDLIFKSMIAQVQGCPRRRSGACDEPADAVGNPCSWARSLCSICFLFKVDGRQMLQRRVAAARVVPTFDPDEQGRARFGLGLPGTAVDQFAIRGWQRSSRPWRCRRHRPPCPSRGERPFPCSACRTRCWCTGCPGPNDGSPCRVGASPAPCSARRSPGRRSSARPWTSPPPCG